MEIVSELDIDGYRWEIADKQARQDVANLKLSSEVKIYGDVGLILKPGYTAKGAKLGYTKKFGKLVIATLMIEDLRGEGLGTDANIQFAELPFKPYGGIDFTVTEVFQNTTFKIWGGDSGELNLVSTERFPIENCTISGLMVCIEK